MAIKEIAIIAIIATQNVTDGPTEKVIMGGELAIQATQLCIDDSRDIEKGFILSHTNKQGSFRVKCQILNTQQGPYYASKGMFTYHDENGMLPTLIKLFEQKGIKVESHRPKLTATTPKN